MFEPKAFEEFREPRWVRRLTRHRRRHSATSLVGWDLANRRVFILGVLPYLEPKWPNDHCFNWKRPLFLGVKSIYNWGHGLGMTGWKKWIIYLSFPFPLHIFCFSYYFVVTHQVQNLVGLRFWDSNLLSYHWKTTHAFGPDMHGFQAIKKACLLVYVLGFSLGAC